MAILDLNSTKEGFDENARHMKSLVTDFKEKLHEVQKGGSEKAREKHLARGKLLPRQRIEKLLDPGSPFLEIGAMAAYGLYDNQVPSAGLITGIGRIEGQECIVVARNSRSEKLKVAIFKEA